MIDPDYLEQYWEIPQVFVDKHLRINDPLIQDPQILLNRAHTRMLIDIVGPAKLKELNKESRDKLIQNLNGRWNGNRAITPLYILELAGLPLPNLNPSDPVHHYLQLLEFQFRGYFQYQTGTSNAFKSWLEAPDPKAVIQEREAINCWELILYVAIIATLVPKDIVATAYKQADKALAVFDALDTLSKSRNLGGVVKIDRTKPAQVQLAPGDVVLIPISDVATGYNMMHHVVGITANSENNDYEGYKAMQSWGSYAAGIPDRIVLGDVLRPQETNKFFRVVRLAGSTRLTGNA